MLLHARYMFHWENTRTSKAYKLTSGKLLASSTSLLESVEEVDEIIWMGRSWGENLARNGRTEQENRPISHALSREGQCLTLSFSHVLLHLWSTREHSEQGASDDWKKRRRDGALIGPFPPFSYTSLARRTKRWRSLFFFDLCTCCVSLLNTIDRSSPPIFYLAQI